MNVRPVLRKSAPAAESDVTDQGSDRDEPSKSRFVTLLQGATVFIVMFVTMYTALRWMLSKEDEYEE